VRGGTELFGQSVDTTFPRDLSKIDDKYKTVSYGETDPETKPTTTSKENATK